MIRQALIGGTLLAVTLLTAGCPSHTRMPEPEQARVQSQVTHRTRQLAVSMYTGPFFRDARYKLLSDQPPGTVDLMRSPSGEPMHPGKAEGVIPAGTEVRIAQVEFPTATAVTTRSLLTPRYFTWVLVEIPGRDQLHAIILRDDPQSHEAFLALLDRYLTTEDVAAKVAALPEPQREAVNEKRLLAGMDEATARMAWGLPLQVQQDFEDGVKVQTWRYEGGRTATLREGVVVSFSEPGGKSGQG